MRAIRFRGRGRTEAPFSCLPAPKLLINIWLIILGSAMTVAVCMLMVGYLRNAQIQHMCEDEKECLSVCVVGSAHSNGRLCLCLLGSISRSLSIPYHLTCHTLILLR